MTKIACLDSGVPLARHGDFPYCALCGFGGVLQISSNPCENSPPHRRSAILIRLQLVDRNDDSPHGSGTQRCCANRSYNRVSTQSARILQLVQIHLFA
jgi:hypothetical protein